jgi:hypothetical protein
MEHPNRASYLAKQFVSYFESSVTFCLSYFQPSLIFEGEEEASAVFTNIRLGWKCQPRAKTLAYFTPL